MDNQSSLGDIYWEITDLPLIIINSHGHLDHACGNFWFQEPVYIHEEDMELCRRDLTRNLISIRNREPCFRLKRETCLIWAGLLWK